MSHKNRHDLTGKSFGYLEVLHVSEPHDPLKGVYWICRCVCEKQTRVLAGNLTSGKTRSCGCQRMAVVRAKLTRHGKTGSPEHTAWGSMWTRCTNPRCDMFPNYGGRGITICDRWRSFENFLSDMGPRPSGTHSLDRIDHNGNYEPANCRWATRSEQARNQRVNRWLTFNGRTMILSDWARELGLTPSAVAIRIRSWGLEAALTVPKDKRTGKRFQPGHPYYPRRKP